ncbi:hypothetical protein G5I_00430 [Acromyrmex echinatior]|uniref:Uncharacterized protein n=1 Tax=Acromyrmex echinatior TaxID=103372 RepID=F4W4V3_ACREC|nr:hypothetical protein G5I_00430 [Acromyrmex echinatior]
MKPQKKRLFPSQTTQMDAGAAQKATPVEAWATVVDRRKKGNISTTTEGGSGLPASQKIAIKQPAGTVNRGKQLPRLYSAKSAAVTLTTPGRGDGNCDEECQPNGAQD